MRNLPSFSALKAFETAARLGSFKAAAEMLNLSNSAISHQIRSLEEQLGEKLFERQSGGVVLSECGREYLKVVRTALDQLEQGTAAIQGLHHREMLRISLLSSFSTLWLIPRLQDFNLAHPDVTIELSDNTEIIDFNSSAIDAAIRYDFNQTGTWPDLVVHPLLEEWAMPVCSPDYLKSHPEIVQLQWSEKHSLIINSRHTDEWDIWFAHLGKVFVSDDHPNCSIMDTSNMTLQAAAKGLGIAMGRTPFVDQYLTSSELVHIHERPQNRGIRHYLVYPPSTAAKTGFTAFRHWLIETSDQCNALYRAGC